MERLEQLKEFMAKHDNVSFMGANVPRVLENLEKADQDGCLREFLLNKKPYISAFTFFVFNEKQQAARGKDQVSVVFALNLYGKDKPGFAERLNGVMKELVNGTTKEMKSVLVLMAAQMELQSLEISLINFADRELLEAVSAQVKRKKGPMVALALAMFFGGAIGMPGFTMIGLIPLTFVCIYMFGYSFMQGLFWLAVKPYTKEQIDTAARPVGQCLSKA